LLSSKLKWYICETPFVPTAFAENIGGGTAFHAELLGALSAIEMADQRDWRNLWIETDLALLVVLLYYKANHYKFYHLVISTMRCH